MLLRLSLFLWLICLASCNTGDEVSVAGVADGSVAEVGPYHVSVADLEEAVVAIFGNDASVEDRSSEDLQIVVDALVAARLLALEAERLGVDEDPTILGPLDSLRAVLLKEAIYETEVHANLPQATEEDIAALYREWGEGEQILGAHILVRTQQTADVVIERLNEGDRFTDLAREFSLHEASSRFGGEMGFLRRSQYPVVIADAIWGLATGTHSSEPVHTSMGWHVVAVSDRRHQSIEEQRNGLVHEFDRRQRQAADEAFVAWLRETYSLVYQPSTAVAVASLSDTLSGHRRLFSWKGGELTLADFLNRVQVPDPVSEDTARMRILAEGLVFDELAAQEAAVRGLSDLSSVHKALQDKRLQMIARYMFQAQAHPGPDTEEVRAFYEDHREEFRSHTQVTIREILVDESPLADSLHQLIAAGQDMEALARQHTVRTDLAKTGGLWQNVRPGDPRSGRIYDASLKQGLGLHPPLKVNGGISVFDVLEISPGRLLRFEEVEEAAQASTVSFRMESLIQRLRASFADVVLVNDDLLKGLAAGRN